MDINVETLSCTPEANIILDVTYISIKKKNNNSPTRKTTEVHGENTIHVFIFFNLI